MKYPRISWSKDRRRKLSKANIIQIRELKKVGFSINFIAKKFNVNRTTVEYWTDYKVRERMRRTASKTSMKRDRIARRKTQRESDRYLKRVNPKLKEYRKYISNKYYNKKHE